jgi:chitinase
LAREIDIRTGNAEEREFNFVRMVADSLQDDLDKYLKEKQGGNGIPKEECDVNRSPNGEAPWAEINSPAEGSSHSGSINVSVNGFSPNGNVTRMEFFLGGTSIGSTSNNSFSGNLAIPDGTLSGNYTFRVVVTDNTEEIGESSVRINISGVSSGLSVDSPSNGSTKPIGPINVQVSHDGSLSDVRLFVQKAGGEVIDLGVMSGSGGNLSATWTPTEAGVYSIWARSVGSGFESETSNVVSVTVE